MTEAERPIGQEVCSSPEELAKLFNQWKLSPEGQFKPFSNFAFGIYLAQETYPFSKKFPYPPISFDQTGEVHTTSLLIVHNRAKGIVLNYSWLKNPTGEKSSDGTFRLISASVEEYAHWVLHQAIERRRSNEYIDSLDTHYEKTLDEVERSINLLKGSLNLAEAGLKELMIRNMDEELNRSKLALLKHQSTIEEYMGKVWQNQVASRYYPWSEEAKDAKENLVKVLTYKRQKALIARDRKEPLPTHH